MSGSVWNLAQQPRDQTNKSNGKYNAALCVGNSQPEANSCDHEDHHQYFWGMFSQEIHRYRLIQQRSVLWIDIFDPLTEPGPNNLKDGPPIGFSSLANNLYQRSFSSPAVKFAIEDLLPRPEIQFPVGNCHDHLADLALQMGVGIIFAGAIVPVGAGGLVWRQFFQPDLVIVMEPALVVINKNGRGNVHGVDQTKTFADAALGNEFLNLWRDVNESASARNFKPEMLGKRFQFP